jgi:hypothetical protein
MVMKLKGGYYTDEPTPQEQAERRKRDEQERRDCDAFAAMLRKDAPAVIDRQTPRDLLIAVMSPIECDPSWASGCLQDLSDELHALSELNAAETDFAHVTDRLSVLSLRVQAYARIAALLERADGAFATAAPVEDKVAAE